MKGFDGVFLKKEKKWLEAAQVVSLDVSAIETLDQVFRDDPEILLIAFRYDSHAFDYADPAVKSKFLANKEFVLKAIKIHPAIFYDISKDLQMDKDVVLEAVGQDANLWDYISLDLQQDRAVFLAAVNQNGLYLEHGKVLFRSDKEIIEAAVKQNPEAAKYAAIPNTSKETSFKRFDPSGPSEFGSSKSDFF